MVYKSTELKLTKFLEFFSSIEEIENQIDFPEYEAFFSSLSRRNVPRESYDSTKLEYERRLKLSNQDPDKFQNFASYLQFYQMQDVRPFLVAIENAFRSFYTNFDINPLRFHSLPSIAFQV